MEEEYREYYIDGYGCVYVNNLGTVVKNKKGIPLSFREDGDGYYFIRVCWEVKLTVRATIHIREECIGLSQSVL